MQIQSFTNQPSYKGKLNYEKGTTTKLTKYTPGPLWRKFKDIASLVSAKPYNVFIMKNLQNDEFYNIAANKSLQEAKKIKEYSVKVKSNAMVDSIVSAAQDAMEMYEKFIAKNIKG